MSVARRGAVTNRHTSAPERVPAPVRRVEWRVAAAPHWNSSNSAEAVYRPAMPSRRQARAPRRAASRALEAALRLMDSPRWPDRANRALTLHMLKHHAPRFFRAEGLRPALSAALDDLAQAPVALAPSLEPDEVMARLDAAYLLAVHGRPGPRLDAQAVTHHVRALEETGLRLPAWLFAGLAQRTGVACTVELGTAFPFREDLETHAYHLTHVVLLETEYLARAVRRRALAPVLDELEAVVSPCVAHEKWDVLGEVLFCLQAGGRPVPRRALAALRAVQQADGRFAERGAPESLHAHTTATALLALAHGG